MSSTMRTSANRGKIGHCRLCGAKYAESVRCVICSWVGHEDLERECQARPENENVKEDDAFRMVLRFGVDAFKRFRAASAEERAEMLRLASKNGWPKNKYGKYACCCCGYFTKSAPLGTHTHCPVCSWSDNGIDWNTYWWSVGNRSESGDEMSVEAGRANFKRFGSSKPWLARLCRPARFEERPLHDWTTDDRPYYAKPTH